MRLSAARPALGVGFALDSVGSRRPGKPAMLDAMDHRMTALERAFQLARSGQVSTITEIVGSLRRDRYDTRQIEGPALRRQLMNLIKAARLEDGNADRP
jgi:hypothetical protein